MISIGSIDLLHVQQIKSMGNRHTFHPNKLKYDVFNLELDIGPVNLLLHGFFLKKLWWVKVSFGNASLSSIRYHLTSTGKPIRMGSVLP